MSLFGGAAGAECSAAANPLSQFTKLVHDEQPQYLERLRLGGGGGSSSEAGSSGTAAAQGLRSEGGVVGEHDAIMESFLHASDGGGGAPLPPLVSSAAAAAGPAFSPSFLLPYSHRQEADGSSMVGDDMTSLQLQLIKSNLDAPPPHEWMADFYRAPLDEEGGVGGGQEESQPGIMALSITANYRPSKAAATATTTAAISTSTPLAAAATVAPLGASVDMMASSRRLLDGAQSIRYMPYMPGDVPSPIGNAAPLFSSSQYLQHQQLPSRRPSLFSLQLPTLPRSSDVVPQDQIFYRSPNASRQRPSAAAATTAQGKGKGRLVAELDEDSWEAQFAQVDAQMPTATTATAAVADARAALLRRAARERRTRQKQALEDPLVSLEDMQRELMQEQELMRKLMETSRAARGDDAAAARSQTKIENREKVEEYQRQLMQLEQENKQRLLQARDADAAALHNGTKIDSRVNGGSALEDYQLQLMLLEQHNKRRLLYARDTEAAAARSRMKIDSRVNGEIMLEDATMASTGYASDLPLRTHSHFSDMLEFPEDEDGDIDDAPLSDPYVLEEDNPFREVDDPFRHGVQIMDEGGNLSVAALAFEAAVQRDPRHVDAWTMLGTAQAQNEKEAPAIRAWQRAVELDSVNLPALMGLAVAYTNEGYDARAYATLERWLAAKYPDIVAADAKLSRSQQQPPVSAQEKLSSLLAKQWQNGQEEDGSHLSPSVFNTDPWSVTPRQPLRERVTDLFIRAAQLSPAGDGMDPDVQVGLGVLLFGAAEHDKAIDCFSAALASTVAGASNGRAQLHLLWNRLGATLANAGRSEEAIAAYERALALRPNFVRARYNLGVSCCNVGCLDAAAQHLLAALALHGGVVAQDSREQARRHIDGARDAGTAPGSSGSSASATASGSSASERLATSTAMPAATAREPDIATAPQHNPSTALYETLRRVFVQMGRQDLAARVGLGMDLDAFRAEFDF